MILSNCHCFFLHTSYVDTMVARTFIELHFPVMKRLSNNTLISLVKDLRILVFGHCMMENQMNHHINNNIVVIIIIMYQYQ